MAAVCFWAYYFAIWDVEDMKAKVYNRFVYATAALLKYLILEFFFFVDERKSIANTNKLIRLKLFMRIKLWKKYEMQPKGNKFNWLTNLWWQKTFLSIVTTFFSVLAQTMNQSLMLPIYTCFYLIGKPTSLLTNIRSFSILFFPTHENHKQIINSHHCVFFFYPFEVTLLIDFFFLFHS